MAGNENDTPDQYGAGDEQSTRIQPAAAPGAAGEVELYRAGGQSVMAGVDDDTVDLPPEAIARLNKKAPPQRSVPRRAFGPRTGDRRPPLWTYIVTTVVVIGVLLGMTYEIVGPPSHQANGVNDINGCAPASPCQVANSYLADYTGGKYPQLYSLLSTASRTRFSDPAILRAAANYQTNAVSYATAQEYITNRTKGILAQAQVYSLSATLGTVKKISATQVSFPARVVMRSNGLGDIVADIVLPLTLEHNAWRVDWSPGLILPQLDSTADPTYTRVVRFVSQTANRGTILSSDGQALALDETVYIVGVVPSTVKNQAAVTQALVANLDLTPAEITAATQGKDANQFWPVRTITPQVYNQVSAALQIPGIQAQQTMGRVYPFGAATAPVTGYIGQVGPSEIASDASHYYESGDIIGRAGVEAWGEQYLRPTKGGELDIRARNADGTDGPIVSTVASRAPLNGEDITTTIDLPTQQAMMTRLAAQSGHTGGSVALAPATGDVLAMGTYPTYDPNDFSLGFTANEQTRFNALSGPYVNRATMAADPTGSIFKLITLSAGLENGISASQIFTCTGTFQVPGENHLRYDDVVLGHGSLNAVQAIAPSCDVVFWTIAINLNQKDPNLLPSVAKKFGFGAATGMIGLPADEDNPGIVPDPAWLKTNKNSGWSPTDAANLGIGQGFFEASPAQVAELSAAVANNGVRMRPRLVSKVSNGGAITQTFAPTSEGTLPLSAANLKILQVAMLGPTNDSTGTTAYDFVGYPITVAGKTGTAESGQPVPDAWFTCYAPASKLSGPAVTPQIAVGTLVEFAGTGEHYAVPVSKAAMDAYLHLPPEK